MTLSFIVAAIGCCFAGLCYAEFAAMIPIAGSAYTYAYVTMGEFVAWIIGWALILEYALGAATVSIAWSEYLNRLFGGSIPYEWCHSPMRSHPGRRARHHEHSCLFILLILTLLLIKGTSESATVNAIIVAVKVAIVLVFIAVGWRFINPANHIAVSDSRQASPVTWACSNMDGEAFWAARASYSSRLSDSTRSPPRRRKPKIPAATCRIGILGSLAVCTVLYILFGCVLTGVAPSSGFRRSPARKPRSPTRSTLICRVTDGWRRWSRWRFSPDFLPSCW